MGGGEMGDAVRDFDWSKTPLGPLISWPTFLRIAVGFCLNSRFPIFVWLGPDLINIYNDAYIPVLGKRHPGALGRRAPDLWQDVWPAIAPQVEAVLERGQASWHERVLLVTDRNGYEEHAYFTYSHSPLCDESGKIEGIVCIVSEETPHVVSERRQGFLVELADALRGLNNPADIVGKTTEALGRHFQASLVGFGYVQPDGAHIYLDASYADGVEPIARTFSLDSFGAENISRQRQGITVVHHDVTADPSNPLASWAALQLRSFVSVPLVREGRFRASLYVGQRDVRKWSHEEVALIEDVAARTWDAMERARA